MNLQFTALIPVVYVIIEALERLGLKKRIAHILAFPIGLLLSFVIIPINAWYLNVLYGLIIGLGAAGTCDTVNNCKNIIKKK